MSEPLVLRAASATGVSLLFWSVAFFARRTLHRRDRIAQSPETAPWQDDALAAVPIAGLFAARDVLRAIIGREAPIALHVAAAIGIFAVLSVALWRVRRARRKSPDSGGG